MMSNGACRSSMALSIPPPMSLTEVDRIWSVPFNSASNEEYDETYDPTAPTTSEPPAATDPFDLDLNDENNETLFQNMQEGDGTYMLDDNEDLMDHTVGNPTDDPSNN